MRFASYFFILFSLLLSLQIAAQSRKVIEIPDIPGYVTLKCDFHMHTVFSDGTVWPTVRVQEAWKEGLDAISITDHIEYRPHTKDIMADHNRSYELAEPLAEEMDIILVKGAEITRSMPPGHLNALFIRNANLLDREDVFDAIKEARDQGAFLLWNHPGWKAQQPDTTLWWDEHTTLLNQGLLHGIEVFNGNFCPEALDWAKDKKLTMFGNSDVHGPVETQNGHRPMTLVFAKSKTQGGIKEALFSRRTAVYFENTIMGAANHMEALFFASLHYSKSPLRLKNGASKNVIIKNNSDIKYELELVQPPVGFDAPENITLEAHHETAIELNGNSQQINRTGSLKIYYQVKNMHLSSDENLVVTFSFRNN